MRDKDADVYVDLFNSTMHANSISLCYNYII